MLAIETRALTRLYGKLAAVQGLDLAIPQGSLYGLIGPNGAGKQPPCACWQACSNQPRAKLSSTASQ